MAEKKAMDIVPLVVGVFAGETVDEMGIIESTIGPFTAGFTGIVKAGIGAGVSYLGYKKLKGAMGDIVLGFGLPLIVSGLKAQFMPPAVAARLVVPGGTVLTPYSVPTGMRAGHPTLSVPRIPPRPGILAPTPGTAYGGGMERALAGKFMLGST